ncbi:hypothetical protein BY996DRAFT_6421267 [Phakopsora pachyrhizi]|uniref:DUF7872 domain-containing protein n=1 Tax=Phakopsora pachyrhizi TaxID=170000 RepID=A0AAV0AN94_PHAPC|nr:hypothetical protein BY996DRAFT_6421267 [Phakopsora pachyrhizi]CAH7669376.1 hypothetical protein PPACK8108_LOCUS3988 [Phakopsora pachyrhizi]
MKYSNSNSLFLLNLLAIYLIQAPLKVNSSNQLTNQHDDFQTNHHSQKRLQRRQLSSLSPFNTGSTSSGSSNDTQNDPECSDLALNRGTWAELGIDNYLLNYPSGQNTSFIQYTRSLNVFNFDCGINQYCLAGQLCHPVRGRDWVVLSAVQEWNFYINSLYKSIGAALGMVQGIASAMVADFLPDDGDYKVLKQFAICLAALSGVMVLSFAAVLMIPILGSLLGFTWGLVSWGAATAGSGVATAWTYLTTIGSEAAIVTAAEGEEVALLSAGAAATEAELATIEGEAAAMGGATATGGAAVAAPKLARRGLSDDASNGTMDKLKMWTFVNQKLTDLQRRMRSIVSINSQESLVAPISSQKGMFGTLQNGIFVSDHPPRSILEENAEEAAQLGALSLLFRTMGLIFVIDSATCKPEGPTTPLKHPELVHFCSSDGVKVSLGMLKKKKIEYRIRNGRMIFSKYTFSTEFLFDLASDCQGRLRGSSPNNINTSERMGGGLVSGLPFANRGSTISQVLMSNSSYLNPEEALKSPSSNSTDSSNKLTPHSSRSTILLPDGSEICSFSLPICDLRISDIKDKISAGKKVSEVCLKALDLQPSNF